MTTPELELENYLPYLVNRVGQRFVAEFTPALAAVGLDVQMWRVLSVLHGTGAQSAGDLSALTSINLSTLSRLVGRMAARGLIRRDRGDADARSVVIALTDDGRRHTEALIPKAAALETAATGNLSAQELDALKALLDRLYSEMAAEKTSAR